MKKLIFIFTIIFAVEHTNAQLQSSWWYFGQKAGLHFTAAGPVCDTMGQLKSTHYCATYSDSAGHLLLYSDGFHVWNRMHQHLPNGDSLFIEVDTTWGITPNLYGSSGGVLILPLGGKQFYVFFVSPYQYYPTNDSVYKGQGFYYYKVDLNLDNGLGDVTGGINYIPLPFPVSSPLGAIRHANGRDWWVVTQESADSSARILKFLITPYGVSSPYFQNLNCRPHSAIQLSRVSGQTVFTTAGDKILMNTSFGILSLFDFDRCSGELSNYIDLTDPLYDSIYPNYDELFMGCSFSPDGNLIYYNNNKYLIQLHMVSETNFARDTIWFNHEFNQWQNFQFLEMYRQQLGPDNKIYLTFFYRYVPQTFVDSFSTHLGVINSPDSLGQACNFVPWAVSTGNRITWGSMPYMPNWNLGPIDGSACDTLGLDNGIAERKNIENELFIYPNPTDDLAQVKFSLPIKENAQLSITDMQGRTIYSMAVNDKSNSIQINTSGFANGLYSVQLISKSKICLNGKLVIAH